MTLAERFIEFNHWTVSKKMTLLTALVLMAHLLGSTAAHLGFSASPNVDVALLDIFLAVWSADVAIFLAISVVALRAGWQGRWLAYAWVTTYSLFIVTLLHLFGLMSSPHVLWYPGAVCLWGLYFDERVGLFSALYLFGLILLVGGLELAGVLPYAPLLIDRSIDAQHNAGWFTAHILTFVVLLSLSFALQWLTVVVGRLQDQRLRTAHTMLERSNRIIRRYVPSQIADRIISGEQVESLRPERTRLTIFFSDIEGFTQASDHMEAETLAALLNEYLSEMTRIAEGYGGTVNQFAGDGIMIFFGAPQATSDLDHALRAVHMALDMQARLLQLQQVWRQRGIKNPFRARIGINTGDASVGDFGSEGRKVYSAIGLQTNIAARIQTHCEPDRVLISQSTQELVGKHIRCTLAGALDLKGVQDAVQVYYAGDDLPATAESASRP